jgi:hypothetical protein
MRAAFFALLSILIVLFVAPPVHADVPPPNTSQCNGKSAGDACTTDDSKSGACLASTCSRLDYSHTPPGSVSYNCLVCYAGAAPSSSAKTTQGGSGCAIAVGGRAAGAWVIAIGAVATVIFARRRRIERR